MYRRQGEGVYWGRRGSGCTGADRGGGCCSGVIRVHVSELSPGFSTVLDQRPRLTRYIIRCYGRPMIPRPLIREEVSFMCMSNATHSGRASG